MYLAKICRISEGKAVLSKICNLLLRGTIMSKCFKGLVKTVKPSYAFIGIESVTDTDGKPHGLVTTKDIYVKASDLVSPVKVGQEVFFKTAPDATRSEAFTALPMRKMFTVELHIDAVVVDHPVVPVRWCLSKEAAAEIAKAPDKEWYIAIVAQLARDESSPSRYYSKKTTLDTMVGLKRIGDGHAYVEFNASGTYDVVMYLVRSDRRLDRLQKGIDKFDNHRSIDVWGNWIDKEIATEVDDLPFLCSSLTENDVVLGYSHITVSLPAEIFAKPLPGWARKWLDYFGFDKPSDQCGARGRLTFAFTAGPIVYAFWELLKRTWMLVLGVLHLCFGGSPKVLWSKAISRQLCSSIDHLMGKHEYQSIVEWEDRNIFLFPPLWIALAALGAIGVFFPEALAWCVAIGVVVGIIIFLLAVFGKYGEGISSGFQKVIRFIQARIHRKEEVASDKLLARLDRYAVCHQVPAAAPVTVRLMWSGIKRRVCRTYG